jgi:hypothetical protein
MFRRILPHIIAVVLFAVIAMLYCKPAMQGKVLQQSDIMYWKAMAQQSFKYKETHGHFPLWTNSMFCGMPAYFIAMDPNNPVSLSTVHSAYMSIFPKPVCFFFLLCLSMYVLCLVFSINPYIAIVGSIGYAYASYSCIIIQVGHETKVLSMAYGTFLLAAVLLIFKKKIWLGGGMAVLFASLLIAMDHIQVTYYYLLTIFIITVSYSIQWLKAHDYRTLFKNIAVLVFAGIVGFCTNMVSLATAYEFSKATRNAVINIKDTSTTHVQTTGYTMDYAYRWSYGIMETFTILVPNIFGGKSSVDLDDSSHFIQYFKNNKVNKEIPVNELKKDWPEYWGNQPSVAGPVYAGAVICFLFLLSLFVTKGINKRWIITIIIITTCMAWGRNLMWFNEFIFKYLPFYNKFRAPSITLVIPQLLMPLLGMMGLQELLYNKDKRTALKQLLTAGSVMAVIAITLFIFYNTTSYQSSNDKTATQAYISQVTNNKVFADGLYKAFLEDRKILFGNDLLRSVVFIALTVLLLLLAKRYATRFIYVITGIFLLVSVDLLLTGRRYLNDTDYKEANTYNSSNFTPTAANKVIMHDKGFFRVLDTASYIDAKTYYYHNSITGYSPTELSIMQNLLTNYQSNHAVLNMLNERYSLRFNEKYEPVAVYNADALGNCWLVKDVRFVDTDMDALKAMRNLDVKDTAVAENVLKNGVDYKPVYDSLAKITLIKNDNDVIDYSFKAATNQFAVFSEVYYNGGWKAYIDNKEVPVIKTNYALRGLAVSAGEHAIRFEFKPAAFYKTLPVAIVASIIGWLAIVIGFVQHIRIVRRTKHVS